MFDVRRAVFVVLPLFAPAFVLTGTASAQGSLWPFDSQGPSARHYRYRADRPTARPAVDVPLPVPRPRFAADGSDATHSTPSPPAVTNGDVPVHADAIEPGATASAPKPAPVSTPVPTPKPADLGGSGSASADHEDKKTVEPGSGATTAFTPRQPSDDQTCFDRLVARKVDVERTAIGPQPDSRCTVVEPVHLLGLASADGTHVAFPDRPTLACATADAFSAYVHDLVAPLVKGSYGAALVAVGTGPGLECRSRDSIFGAKLSAHGQGLAVDIAQIQLSNGRAIDVGIPKDDADKAFETAARAGGCGYFHTVLGPGSDSYHRTHWHFDLLVRGKDGDSKYCK